ncbi:hypothetical protein ACIRQF_11065 [Streptomyces sp. NPDC101191]|uniref:hypothetical protein n=1 Tax=Streptomyces sp. NPDC101191 TaxID=3366126 RepID=UPI00381F4ABE
MSDGRGEPDVPRPEDDAAAHAHGTSTDPSAADRLGGEQTASPSHGTTPGHDGGFTDPAPGGDGSGIIVQGGRTAHGPQDPTRAIGPKQDDPRAIGPKQDDPRAIGPKQDDPRAIGPKQDDPRAVGRGIIVQGGRTGHPGTMARQKRDRKKMKTMALVIGGVMVVAAGGAIVGRQWGHDPATVLPQAAATPAASASAEPSGAVTPTPTSGSGSPSPTAGESTPATQADSPTPAASDRPTRGDSSPSPVPRTPSARPTRSSPPAPAAAPVLSLGPTRVQEYCANGEWPDALVIRNSGGGELNWSVGPLPSGVTLSTGSGSLAADASQEITLGGRAEQQPANGRFTIGFSSNGGSGQVTVVCA